MGTLEATDGTGVVWGKNLTSFPFAEMKIAPTPPPSPSNPHSPSNPPWLSPSYLPPPSYAPSPSNPPTPAGIVYAVATRNED